MARRVFFSFHYQRDLWRVNVVRNSGVVEGVSAAGFHDASLWEETKRKGDSAVKALINKGLDGTSVTIALIGARTSIRQYVDFEIRQSIARGNGLFGIYIDAIKDQSGATDTRGTVPSALAEARVPVYTWTYGKLGTWVEEAYFRAHPTR